MRRTQTILVSVLACVSALTACGGGGGDDDDTDTSSDVTAAETSSAITTDACPSAGDIGTAVGYDATGPDETDAGVYLQCLYDFESDALDDELVVGVAIVKLYADDAAGSLEIFRDVYDDETEASGYGDEASFSDAGDSLFVRSGDRGVEVTFSGLGSTDDAEVLSGAVAMLVID